MSVFHLVTGTQVFSKHLSKEEHGTARPSGSPGKEQLLQEVGSLWKADIHHQIKLLEPYITFGVSHVGV